MKISFKLKQNEHFNIKGGEDLKKENLSGTNMLKLTAVFVFGGLCYGIMEVLSRGFTHISMGILGGFAFLVIHILNGERIDGKITLISILIISSLFITSIEFIAGEYLNRILGLNIWSYKDMWLNVDGQICLPFTLLWSVLSLLGIIIDNLIRKSIFKENKTKGIFEKNKFVSGNYV